MEPYFCAQITQRCKKIRKDGWAAGIPQIYSGKQGNYDERLETISYREKQGEQGIKIDGWDPPP